MVSHLVLFRLRPDLTEADREGLLQAFERALQDIPSVRRFRIGRRVTFGARYEQASPDLRFSMLIDFDDLSGLKEYLDHPAHDDLGSRFNASIAEALVYDYARVELDEARNLLTDEGRS